MRISTFRLTVFHTDLFSADDKIRISGWASVPTDNPEHLRCVAKEQSIFHQARLTSVSQSPLLQNIAVPMVSFGTYSFRFLDCFRDYVDGDLAVLLFHR